MPRRRLLRALLAAAILVASPSPCRADDVADEADLQFRIGAERYTAGDYRGALEHFLASNRLVRNRNVVFNIARTYEKLERYPEAYRYYALALAEGPDPQSKADIDAALSRIASHVAVLQIETTPPGATLYVDRKDLGPRGESPRTLALAEGSYRIIAELPGYEPAEARVAGAKAGRTTPVSLVLAPILSPLRIDGAPPGARVFLDGGVGVPRCTLPCKLDVPPGHHTLRVERDGYRPYESTLDVVAGRASSVEVRLEPIKGAALVITDEPGALIHVDGAPFGFTPAVLSLPIGDHVIRLSRRGYVPRERPVVIRAEEQTRVQEALLRVENVEAASRTPESVEGAPSSVTILPREELVAFGYPTVAAALRGVRGVYVWDDRTYASLGVRGVGRLGNYTNRVLVLQDGHPTNDDWIGSAYIGFDGRTDLADIERIEVVRGPGSVLYGTNAFSGVVNLVTRSENPLGRRAETSISAVDYGVTRARARGQTMIGKDLGVWMSVVGARGVGRDFFFPELEAETADTTRGASRGADGFDAGTVQGRVFWKWLTAQWFLHSHEKSIPTGEFDTLLSDPRSKQRDTRSFVEVRAEPALSETVKLESRLHWNLYRYRGRFARAAADGGVERDTYHGQWVGAEQRVVFTPKTGLRFTLGGEAQYHYRADQVARDDSGVFLDDTGGRARTYRAFAMYGLADVAPVDAVHLSAGARLDSYSTFGESLNPRAALTLKPYPAGNSKVLFGKAFRAPSVYELYYNDGGITQTASPGLGPESIYSFEIEHQHRFDSALTGIAAVYANEITNLIVARGSGNASDPLHYANASTPLVTLGAELAVRRDWRRGFMVQASGGVQGTRFVVSESLSDVVGLVRDPTVREVANSPTLLASLKAAAPVIERALTLASRLTFEGVRYDRYELVSDPAQGKTSAAVVWDVVLTGRAERFGLGYTVGAYNLADYRYSLPVSAEFSQRTILQSGRTFLASLDLTF